MAPIAVNIMQTLASRLEGTSQKPADRFTYVVLLGPRKPSKL